MKVFRSAATGKLKEGESAFLKNEFGAGVPVYWMGSYVDLEMQAREERLKIEGATGDEGWERVGEVRFTGIR